MSIYRDFLKFLDACDPGGDLWSIYEKLYFAPHEEFLSIYWRECIGLGLEELRERVQSISLSHYSHLLSLLRSCNLEEMCSSTLQKCYRLLQWSDEPAVYLMVGFFSPDGFVIPLGDRNVIGIGLERYKSFRNLPVILAHECCHYMQDAPSYQLDELTVGEAMLREGICIAFSRIVFPERPLVNHLGISRGRLNWLRAHEKLIWRTIEPAFSLTGRDNIQRYLYGVPGTQTEAAEIPISFSFSRSGLYMGFRIAQKLLDGLPNCDMKAITRLGPEDALRAYSSQFS